MSIDLLILAVGFIIILLQLITFAARKRLGSGYFLLLVICGLFWGGIFYFYYGLPLDDGMVHESKLSVFNRGFYSSVTLIFASVTFLIFHFLRKK